MSPNFIPKPGITDKTGMLSKTILVLNFHPDLVCVSFYQFDWTVLRNGGRWISSFYLTCCKTPLENLFCSQVPFQHFRFID